jgi:small GTP-binding protein
MGRARAFFHPRARAAARSPSLSLSHPRPPPFFFSLSQKKTQAKLAKLRRELLEPSGAGAGGGGRGDGFDVTKVGDARVGLVGFPSVGKSTLLTKLTGTFSEVAAYEFTTLTCVPGVIRYRGAKIQLLDLPGIIEGAKDGKGRGRQVIATARTCNLIIIVLDVLKPLTHKRLIEHELEGFGIRLNKRPPAITYRKKERGGIAFTASPDCTRLDLDAVKAVLSEYRVHNADVHVRGDCDVDDLVDVIEGNRTYVPAVYAVNKVMRERESEGNKERREENTLTRSPASLPSLMLPPFFFFSFFLSFFQIDQITLEELNIMAKLPHYVPVCAYLEWNLDGLVQAVWERLALTRIYTKPKGKLPDWNDPVVLTGGNPTVEDFANRIHRSMMKQFKWALVWGASARHRPQRVGKEHVLQDEDVVQIVKK